jgi:hypothetical protein
MVLIKPCVLYLILNLTNRPALAERTCSCDFQEYVRLRSEGPRLPCGSKLLAFVPRAVLIAKRWSVAAACWAPYWYGRET